MTDCARESRVELIAQLLVAAQAVAETIYRPLWEIPECCETDYCRQLLGVPYGRLADLSLTVRRLILGYMPATLVTNADGWRVRTCEWCFGAIAIDDLSRDFYFLPCSFGRCAGVDRSGTWLGLLPRDLWLEIAGYTAWALSRECSLQPHNLFSGEMRDGYPREAVLYDRRGPYGYEEDFRGNICTVCSW